MMRDSAEVEAALNDAEDVVMEGGTKYPGMTYEEGVAAAFKFALGYTDENPMSDE